MLKISVDLQMDWYEWLLLQTKHHPGLGYPAWVLGNISSSFFSKKTLVPAFCSPKDVDLHPYLALERGIAPLYRSPQAPPFGHNGEVFFGWKK